MIDALAIVGRAVKAVPTILLTILLWAAQWALKHFGILTPQTAAPRGWDVINAIVRAIISNAAGLLALKTDYQGFREWVLRVCAVLEPMADLTGIPQDDLVVELLAESVRHDPCYDRIYALLTPLLGALPRSPMLSDKAQLDATSLTKLISALPLVYPPS